MEHDPEHREISDEEWVAIPPNPDNDQASTRLSRWRAHLWALVLEARFIPCHISPRSTGWQLLVPPSHLASALNELRLFEAENRNWPPPAPPERPLAENTLATLSVLILLATFHNITRLDIPFFGHTPPDWAEIGSAQAARILDGEWWRVVTALTLHADWLHLFSNLAIGGFFVVCLCRELGSGLAWSLLLSAGALGNWANAHMQLPTHNSVGASTTVFGCVGILAAISLIRYRHHLQRRWPLPVASALALLALLGTEGKRTDLGAHLFGFLFGILLGLATEYLVGRFGRPGRGTNALLALVSTSVVIASWWAALVLGK